MFRLAVRVILALGMAAAAYGDAVPVQGSTSGIFSIPTTGTASGATWTFGSGANESSLVFAGSSFGLANTPLTFNLGSLTFNNGGQGSPGTGSYTSLLTINVAFTTPAGQSTDFLDTITLQVDNGAGNKKVAVTSIPGPQSFTVSSTTYTVTFDGMFTAASGGTDITGTGLSVLNPGGGDADNVGVAYLRATVTANGSTVPPSEIPEPGSVSLLLTAIGGVAFSLYRKRLV